MKNLVNLVIFSICATITYSQDKWDLERCVLFAIENSIDVTQAGFGLKTAQINTKQSEHQRYPSLNFGSNLNLNFGRTIDPTTDAFITSSFLSNGYSLNAGITVFGGGRINNAIERDRWSEKVAEADRDGVINLLTVNVINAYFEILFAEDNYDNSAIQLKTTDDQIDQMSKMVEAGTRARFELYDLEAQKASFEQELTIAQNRIDLAYLNLLGLLNLPSDFDLTIEEPPVDQEVYTDINVVSLDEVYEKAINFQPRSRSLDYQIQSASSQVDVSKGAYLPTVTFGAGLITNYSNRAKDVVGFVTNQFSNNVLIDGNPSVLTVEQQSPILEDSPYFTQFDNNLSYGFGLNLSVPIYNNYNTKANEQRAKVTLDNLMAEKDKNEIELKNFIMQLITDARASKRSLEAADKTLSARQTAFENAEKRYNLGAINSYDYINAQDQLSTALTNQLIGKYDYMLKIKVLDYYQGYPVSLK